MSKRNNVFTQAPIQTRCRRDILLIPALAWIVSFWMYFLMSGSEGRSLNLLIFCFCAAVCLYITHTYGREVAVSLLVKDGILTVARFGYWRKEYPIQDVTCIHCALGKGVHGYTIFAGKKRIAYFSTFSTNAGALYRYLLEQNPSINLKHALL